MCYRRLSIILLPLLLAACASAPPYAVPTVLIPAAYREANIDGWKLATPALPPDGPWWTLYEDPILNALQADVLISNQTLQQVDARRRQAQALVASAQSALWPSLTAGASVTRRNDNGTQTTIQTSSIRQEDSRQSYAANLNLAWEADVWGRLRGAVDAQSAGLVASEADLAAARLSVQSDVAITYFSLRAIELQQSLLEDTLKAYERSLVLTGNRYAAGVSGQIDVAQAETQLSSTRGQALALAAQRAQLLHALALLLGKTPAAFSLAPDANAHFATLPPFDVPLPSSLLERRPDVAAAERRVAAANAQIGVANAAFFPAFTFSALLGFQSASVSDWLTVPNRVWSLGPALAATLFDGGRRRALSDQAVASYDETVATYRQTALTAFKEVEDSLSTLRYTNEQLTEQAVALKAARQAQTLTENQYRAGTVDYLNVVTAQATTLNLARNEASLQGQRLVTSVQLVKALGGRW